MNTRFLPRPKAKEYLEQQYGMPMSDHTLPGMAHRGEGPPYVIIANRALYKAEDLDKWVAEQAAQQPKRKRA